MLQPQNLIPLGLPAIYCDPTKVFFAKALILDIQTGYYRQARADPLEAVAGRNHWTGSGGMERTIYGST